MEFRILGPLEVLANGQALDLGGLKQRALLAMLLLEPNRAVSTSRLIDAVWEEDPPDTAAKALQVYVSRLRKLLGRERLETRAPGYRLRVDEGELDLDRVRRLVEEGAFDEALVHWRGTPLSDLAPLRFAQVAAAGLEELRLSCVEQRMEGALAEGRHLAVAGELEMLVVAHPLRERMRAQLMLALYRCGRQAEALAAYQAARSALVDGLGIEPSRSLRELQQAILIQDPVLELPAASEAVLDPSGASFVGRERELERLVAGLSEALAGNGCLFLLVGEPGIGKTRLADEVVARARGRGAGALVGRCWEAGGAPAYWPWVQSLRGLVRSTAVEDLRFQLGAGAAVLAQLLPELEELFPDLPRLPTLEAESARFRLFEAVSMFLRNAASSRPLVLVLDDLHAADEPSLLLLQFLARELADSRLLVVAAYRNVDPTPNEPLRASVTELAREPVTRTVTLAGLAEEEVGQFIERTAGHHATKEVVAAIHEETEGNPLFVGEVVRLLATEGNIADAEASGMAIPQSVRDVIVRRLRHLSEECNRVLVLASVLGREFALEALARIAGGSEDDLLDALDAAMTADVICDVPGAPGHLRFAHVLIRDTLYEGLTTPRRVRIHRLAVDTLEQLYGEAPGPRLAELAYHCTAGSEFGKAFHYARLAGDRALALLAYEEAARLYQAALDAGELAGSGDQSRCELLLLLGEAELRTGNSPVAKETFLEAARIARKLGLARDLARAAAGYGGRIAWSRAGEDSQLIPLLQEGLSALTEEEVELRARLLSRMSGALRDEHSRERRDTISREAVELARGTGNPNALSYALDGRAAAIFAPDTLTDCLALGSELVELGRGIGDPEQAAHGLFHRIVAQIPLGKISEAKAELEQLSEIANELKDPALLWQSSAMQAMLALAEGRFDQGKHLSEYALTYGERAMGPLAISAHRLQGYALSDSRGALTQIEPTIRASVAEQPARPVFRCALTHLYARLGRTEDAGRELEQLAARDAASLPFDMEWLLSMSFLAETCTLLRHQDCAEILYRSLLPYSALNAVDSPEQMRGSISRDLANLAALLERREEAERHFNTALNMNERMDARPWLAHTQRDYAQLLTKNGETRRASELLEAARTTYRELGIESQAASSKPWVSANS
jgi:DNA-binding SARP family transcriptional activator